MIWKRIAWPGKPGTTKLAQGDRMCPAGILPNQYMNGGYADGVGIVLHTFAEGFETYGEICKKYDPVKDHWLWRKFQFGKGPKTFLSIDCKPEQEDDPDFEPIAPGKKEKPKLVLKGNPIFAQESTIP